MRLSAERLDVVEGERIRAVGMVAVPMQGLLVAGGLDHLRHTLEDTGFRDVNLFLAPPMTWTRSRDVTKPIGFEWPIWLELTPKRTASLQRDITEVIRILDAWAASSEPREEEDVAPLHPYAVAVRAAMRVAGIVRAFAVAYSLDEVA